MKRSRRRRNARVFNNLSGEKDVNKVDYPENRESGRSVDDVPIPILVDILLRLNVKRILICKCVCKTWHKVISNPKFAELHFVQAEASPLLRSSIPLCVSRTLYFVEPPKILDRFTLGHCIDGDPFSKFKIPLRNAEMLFDIEGDVNCEKGGYFHHNSRVVNSCNGFLCLAEPEEDCPLIVCNPVTGEYIDLSSAKKVVDDTIKEFTDCGLGFSPKTNQYKMIRMFNQWTDDPFAVTEVCDGRMAEILTLGTGLWRSIGSGPYSTCRLAGPTYLNGALHWYRVVYESPDFIVSFDFDNEEFGTVPPPSDQSCEISALGVLRGCLCVCDAFSNNTIDIWVMKEYGVQGSWMKELSIDIPASEKQIYGFYQPINYLEDGALLLFHNLINSLIYYDPKGSKVKYLNVRGRKLGFEAIAHVPSLISLEDVLMGGNNAVVLNIKSRCGRLKLRGESEALFLVEENK